jgi:hypothetical protein
MANLLDRLRTRQAPTTAPPELRWPIIEAADTPKHPGLVVDLVEKRIDGMMVNGIFTQPEIDRALAAFDACQELATIEPFGSMFPMPLNQMGWESQDRTPYLEDVERAWPMIVDAFGFDPHERLASVLGPMLGHYRLEPPSEGGRSYAAGNVRRYEPGQGGLKAHIGNEFIQNHDVGAMSHLLTVTQVRDHMSYFIVLKKPTIGGVLSVYGVRWGEDPERQTGFGDGDRNDDYFDDLPCQKFDAAPGSLIMFGGGWRWHRVDPVQGPITRMTYGGFASPSLDGEAINTWC